MSRRVSGVPDDESPTQTKPDSTELGEVPAAR